MTTRKKNPAPKDKAPADTALPEGVAINLAAVIPQLQNPDPEVIKAATQALETAVALEPNNPLALHGLGIAYAQKQKYEEAFELFERATVIDPKFAPPFANLGNLHRLAGRNVEALKAYRHALTLQPSLADAHYNISILLEQEGKADEAQESLKRALLFRPTYSEAHNNLGNILLKNGKTEEAISHFRQALVWNSELKQARTNLIIALYRVGRCADAQSEVDKALAQSPGDATILRTQAAGLAYQGLLEDARKVNLQILELEPDAADVQLNMGELALARDDYEGALACYRALLARKNVHPALCVSAMAYVMLAQGNLSEARDMFQQGLMLDERLPTLTIGLGKTLLEAGDIALAIQTLRHATEILPGAAEIHSLLIHALHLSPPLSSDERNAEMQRWVERHSKKETVAANSNKPASTKRLNKTSPLRLGFLVGDADAPMAAGCLEALFSHLDTARIDAHVYHTGGKVGDQTKRLKELVSHWYVVAPLSASDLAERIHEDGIEILIDTTGHHLGNRLVVFAKRAAPVQVTWLGDFSNTGLPEMDYRLTDAVMTPQEDAAAASERPIYLPVAACYTPNQELPTPSPLPARTAGNITFGAPSRLGYINAPLLDTWAEILTLVPGSRLVIFSNLAMADEASFERLKKLFLLREIEPERLEILPRLDQEAYGKALASLDLVLDSFPFPLGLRALDCLWMGVPVLTLAGADPYQRATLTCLAPAGLSEWGAESKEEYIAKAVAFAGDLDNLERIRCSLRDTLLNSPLLDTQAFAQSFTSALEKLRPQKAPGSPKRERQKPG
ncbi:MAG: tetratricopeptide repeat protein [Sulfuricella sp.]|nr:tetratricopeptide repeat protein [Sulfuricella sp.]